MYNQNFTENETKVNPFESDELLKQLAQASEVPQENTALFSRRLTFQDFQQPPAPREWIVEKLFAAGSLSIVVGEAGSKKTWAMLDAAVCVALGKSWLDFATIQSPVLLVCVMLAPRLQCCWGGPHCSWHLVHDTVKEWSDFVGVLPPLMCISSLKRCA